MNDRKFNINITDYEAPDFNFQLSREATAELKKKVFDRIEKIERNNSADNSKIISFRRKFISFIVAATLLIASTTAIASITNTRQQTNIVDITQPTTVKIKKSKEKTDKTTVNDDAVTSAITASESYTFPVAKEKTFVKLMCNAMKDYTIINRNNGWYSFIHNDGYNGNKNVDLEIIYCDSPWSRDFVQQAGLTRCQGKKPVYQQFFLENRKAMYITYPYGGTYTQQLFIQQHGTRYVFTLIAGDGISKEELIDMGRKIRLDLCKKSDASKHVYFSEYLENYNPDYLIPLTLKDPIDRKNISEIRNPVLLENCEITVENITTYKNISSFISNPITQTETESTEDSVIESTADVTEGTLTEATEENTAEGTEENTNESPDNSTEETLVEETEQPITEPSQETHPANTFGINSVLMTNLDLFVNPDGSLPFYERKSIVQGDGLMIPAEKTLSQVQTRQNFCVVELKIKNTTEKPVVGFNTQLPLTYLYKADGALYYNSTFFHRPVMEEMCQKDNLPACYFAEDKNISLDSGEEKTIQLGYFVDEDLMSELYLSIANSNCDSHIKVDISM